MADQFRELPLPPFYDPAQVGRVWQVPYTERAGQARQWAEQNNLSSAARDRFRLSLIVIDMQNTFCLPGFELFVGGRSGLGAVDDSRRLVEFIYRNLASLTHITATLDTHQAMQIFHPVFLVDDAGSHPAPYTLVTHEDIRQGRWKLNPHMAEMLGIDPAFGQQHLEHYTSELKEREKYDLTVWPYHAMLGGIGHALVSALEEAAFVHSIARYSQAELVIKGQHPLTEAYSAVGPEVTTGPNGEPLAARTPALFDRLLGSDAVVIAGEAKSHCVAWTVADLLRDLEGRDPALARKIYLLEDCMSPVVVPGAIDYTEAANAEFDRFEQAGMHRVQSTTPIAHWPGLSA